MGYEVVRSPNTYGFAAVHAIRIHPDGLDGGADPGHDGIVHGGVAARPSRDACRATSARSPARGEPSIRG